MRLYKSYTFKDHDPILDRMKTMVQDEDLSYQKISDMSGVSAGTLGKWFNRKAKNPTRRPQFSSIMAVSRALGYDLQIVKPARRVSAEANVKFTRNITAKADLGHGTATHH